MEYLIILDDFPHVVLCHSLLHGQHRILHEKNTVAQQTSPAPLQGQVLQVAAQKEYLIGVLGRKHGDRIPFIGLIIQKSLVHQLLQRIPHRPPAHSQLYRYIIFNKLFSLGQLSLKNLFSYIICCHL